MLSIVLLAAVTVLYAGYNILIKFSGLHVPAAATTTVLATLCLQVGALATSAVFFSYLHLRGGQVFSLSPQAYAWAIFAGLCIGAAEIGYFYLFGGIGMTKPMPANVAIPVIVSGTIVISILFSLFVFKELIGWQQLLGIVFILAGILLLFVTD